MRITALLLVITASCVSDPELGALDQASTSGCRPSLCGLNAGELSSSYFHDLHLDGLANEEGFAIVDARKHGIAYKVDVVNGRMSATPVVPIVGGVLTGAQLVGLEIRLRRTVNGTSVTRFLRVTETYLASYWPKLPNGNWPGQAETYRFAYGVNGSFVDLCQNGTEYRDATTAYVPMRPHHAVVFEGDRIDVQSLRWLLATPGQNANRWFNFGCAETALAKLHLNGMTRASQAAGFSSTMAQRQTFLRMIMADYCGVGVSFTENGQPIRWTGTNLTFDANELTEVEARWNQDGAICLNTPRVTANPTAASLAAYPNGVEGLIRLVCGGQLPPTCSSWGATGELRSHNPL